MGKQRTLHLLAILLGVSMFLFAGTGLAQTDHTGHGEDSHATETESGHEAVAGHGEDAHGDEHGEDGGDAHGDGHGDGHSAIPHLTNILGYINIFLGDPYGEHHPVAKFLNDFTNPIFSMITVIILISLFAKVKRELSLREPGRLQMAIEMLMGGLYGLFESIIGPTARRYTPYLGTLFLFILINNFMGMFPLMHSSTSNFATTTFGLGLCTFFYVQGIAIKENGILGYLHHMAGSPKTGMDWGFSILLFPLHILGELIKPISLSLRLFGNIFGEDTLVATMVILGAGIFAGLGQWWIPGIPLQMPFYLLGILGCTIQATVFTLLSTVYIALMLPHDEHHEEAHGH